MNEPDSVLSANDVEHIITHMNEDHSEDLIRYAQVYTDVTEVEEVRMTGIDAEGFDLDVQADGKTAPVRIDFDMPLETVEDARSALVDLAIAVREKAER